MSDIRAPNKEEVRKAYEAGEGSFQQLADKYNIKVGTIKSWAKRDKDNGQPWEKVATKQENKNKKVATEKKVVEDKKEDPILNKNNEIEACELTERQRLFAEIYVRTPIAYKAAIKAGYSPNSAFVEGSRLLTNVKVKAYINYLKELKRQSIMLDVEDLVDKYTRIAFSDITDFVDFGQERIPVISNGVPVMVENSITGKKEILTQTVNSLKLRESFEVDGEIISEIKTSRQGVSIKLEDRLKAMDWLSDYFEFNPEHKYRKEFDNKKLQLERERFEHQKKMDESKVWL